MNPVVVIALGSNLPGEFDSSDDLLAAALERMSQLGLRTTGRSRFWRSAAWPQKTDPPFVNAVLVAETRLPPASLMAALLGLEASFGRTRGAANTPRTLDLDLVDYDGRILKEDGLVLPHCRAHERRFVMGPLAEIAPEWRHPVIGETALALAATAPVGADARPT